MTRTLATGAATAVGILTLPGTTTSVMMDTAAARETIIIVMMVTVQGVRAQWMSDFNQEHLDL